MSKEFKGKNGKIVGTMEYFDKLNESCVLGKMVKKYDFNYYSSIKDISSKTNKMFDEVCSDLRNNEKYLSYIDKGDKKDTIEILKGMADMSKIVGGSISGADKCISLLDKIDKSKSGASDSDVTKSAKFVLSNKYFNKKDSIKVLEDCIRDEVNKATKSNANKEKFMKEVVRSSKSGYLEDVLIKVYYLDSGKKITGKCGKVLCSKEYNNHIANAVTGGVGANGSVEYGKSIRNGLKYVATKLNDDLDKGNNDNDYIQDKNANNLIKFIEDLAKCGENSYNLSGKIMKLAWFVGGDTKKILQLQKNLNAMGIECDSGKLFEDGVYSKETKVAWDNFYNTLARGATPSLEWVDPLKSDMTGIQVKQMPRRGQNVPGGEMMIDTLWDYSLRSAKPTGVPVFRADVPHGPYENMHINTLDKAAIKKGNYIPTNLQMKVDSFTNHKSINDKAFSILKKFDNVSKPVRIGGRVLLVGGVVLDTLELCSAIEADLKDADKKLGKKTVSTTARIGGRWGIGWAGAEAGAYGGATIGTMILPGIGTVVGGAVGGVVLGIAGAFAGDALGEWIVDMTYVGE